MTSKYKTELNTDVLVDMFCSILCGWKFCTVFLVTDMRQGSFNLVINQKVILMQDNPPSFHFKISSSALKS